MTQDFNHNELKSRNLERHLSNPERKEKEFKNRQDRNPHRQSRANVRNLLAQGRYDELDDLEEAA